MNVRRWAPVAGAAALLAGVALAAAFGSLGTHSVPLPVRPAPSGAASAESEPTPTDLASQPPFLDLGQHTLPNWVVAVVQALCLGAAAALVAFLVWQLVKNTIAVKDRPLPEPGDGRALADSAREVVAALDASLADLTDADADPRRAVIACWVRLEQAAAAAGTPRAAGETPADLVGRLLADHRVSQPVLDGFAAVYREARYATHVVDEDMRATAVRALTQLRGELAVLS
jgi:hypothetical protein